MTAPLRTATTAVLFVALVLLLSVTGTLLRGNVAASAATPVSLGFVGDTGATTNTDAVVDAARNAGVSTFINLGDLSYSQTPTESAWCTRIQQHAGAMKYQFAVGNHEDQDGPDGIWSNFAGCMPDTTSATGSYPRQYYSDFPATQPLVRTIMVSPKLTFSEGSTYWSYKAGTQGYTFVQQAIDSARTAGIPYVVVVMHMYCLSLVDYPCAASPDLMNLLFAKRVDVFLQAHDHAYARSKQLALNASCPAITVGSFNPACIADASPTSSYTAGNGTVLATVGSGGRSLNKENPNKIEGPYFQSYMGTNNNPTYGFLKIDVTDTTLTGTFVRGSGGSYTDKFTVTRPAPTATATPTATSSPTATDTPTPTATSSPTATDTPTPTATSSPTATATATPTTSIQTLLPDADSWVGSDLPTTTHGADTALYVDGSPVKVSYLKYDLSALAGKTVVGAALSFTTTTGTSSGSPDTQSVRSVADTSWTESALTYDNRPPVGTALGSVSGTSPATTYTVQLPVAGVQALLGQRMSLAIDSPGGDAFYVNSRESTGAPAKLVLTLQ